MQLLTKRMAAVSVIGILIFGLYTIAGTFPTPDLRGTSPSADHSADTSVNPKGSSQAASDHGASTQAAAGQGSASPAASGQGTSTQASASSSPGMIDPNAVVSDDEQSHVMQGIGQTPDLSEVYIDKTLDGRIVISVTAELTDHEAADDKSVSDRIISAFIQKAFALRPRIAGCMINVVKDNHLVAGAALGEQVQSSFASKTTAAGAAPSEVVSFLKERSSQSQDITQDAWYYFGE